MGSHTGGTAPAGLQRRRCHQPGPDRGGGRSRHSGGSRFGGAGCGFYSRFCNGLGRWFGDRLCRRFWGRFEHGLDGFGDGLGFGRRLGSGFLDGCRSRLFRGGGLDSRLGGFFGGGFGCRLGFGNRFGHLLHGFGSSLRCRFGFRCRLGGRFGRCLGLFRLGFHNVSPLESSPGLAHGPPSQLPGQTAAARFNPSCCQISWFVCRLPAPKTTPWWLSTRFVAGFVPGWTPDLIFRVFWSARDCSGWAARRSALKTNRWRIETNMEPSAFYRPQADSLPQTRHCSRPCTKISLGKSMPMKTILLFFFSPSAQAGPRSLPMSWCTPWKITLRSVPSMFRTPL